MPYPVLIVDTDTTVKTAVWHAALVVIIPGWNTIASGNWTFTNSNFTGELT